MLRSSASPSRVIATPIVVGRHYHHDCFDVEVVDDCTTTTGSDNTGGHGLIGMRERVALYGRTLHRPPARGRLPGARRPFDVADTPDMTIRALVATRNWCERVCGSSSPRSRTSTSSQMHPTAAMPSRSPSHCSGTVTVGARACSGTGSAADRAINAPSRLRRLRPSTIMSAAVPCHVGSGLRAQLRIRRRTTGRDESLAWARSRAALSTSSALARIASAASVQPAPFVVAGDRH
jgi:hypothetical protein